MSLRTGVLLVVAALTALCGCTPDSPDGEPASTDVAVSAAVSIPPQAWLVDRVGSERVRVEALVDEGQSPATYEPTPAQIASLDAADVYFRIGVPFEDTLMERITGSMPDLNVVDLRRGIELRPVSGDHSGHAHGRKDPHTWLDPDLAAVQAQTIHDELVRLDPAGADAYAASLEAVQRELRELDSEIAQILRPLQGRTFFVFHPAFGYFADAYGLKQQAIEIEGKEPAPRELERIIEQARDRNLDAIFVQEQFSSAAPEAIAGEVDAQIVRLNPLARDYPSNSREMARKIRDALHHGGDE